MDLLYRRLVISDLPVLIRLRIEQLKDEGAEETFDLRPNLMDFYTRHIKDGTFVAWVAIDSDADNEIIATAGMSFVEKPPYYSNPYGKIGLLTNMFTMKEYRRKGIAKHLLGLVVDEAKRYGCGAIHITASEQGMLLYRDFGFEHNERFMQCILKGEG